MVVEKVPTEVLIRQMYQQKFDASILTKCKIANFWMYYVDNMSCVVVGQALLSEIELLDRFRLTHYNYESLEEEKNSSLKDKEEAVSAKDTAESKVKMLEERLRRQGEELEGVRQEVLRERLKVGELELARRKWEEEVVRLRDRYETPEGLINVETEKTVITLFFKEERCFRLISQVAAPVARDTLVVLRDHI